MKEKKILMLARRDPREAMRVTAGLAVRGHHLTFYFLVPPEQDASGRIVNLEMLEVMEIEAKTLLPGLDGIAILHTQEDLSQAISKADHVVSI
ncbi:MAG: hypothetical protein OQK35_03275 [Alphaproteobacteria bacterium]|nr:hypothetical protein [Rhodospirillales bacterium]MCW9045333.1 hypothetical protein [Alphaproteobacteria bacterium]